MTTTPTQNLVPSEAAVDLKFNAGKIDEFVTSFLLKYTDRLGRDHLTIEGMRDIIERAIKAFGFVTMDSFEDGATLDNSSQVLRWESNGEYYRWDGSFPKVVPASSTPFSAGGIGSGLWLSVGDATLRSQLASDGGSLLVTDFSSPDAYSYIAEANSFDQLRTLPPRAEGVKIKLRGYRTGSLLGGGVFVGRLSAASDNAITIASSGGAYHWVREDTNNIDAFQCGAYGDDSHDDEPYIQAGINYLSSLSLVAGNVRGGLVIPFGYTYLIKSQLQFNTPIKFHMLGNMHFDVTGAGVRVGMSLAWNVGYDIYFKNVYADNTLSFPTTIVDGGNSFSLITSMNFSNFRVDHATGFNDKIFDLRADGSLGYQQVIQHNTFSLGQIVNSGIGIKLLSLDAATSSAQGNRFYIQNIYQNYKNIEIDNSTHDASNSNTFYINAMDNCRDVGIDLYGHLNTFYIGFAGAPGTALRENSSYGNTITFGNSVPTDLVINYGIDANNTIKCAHPGDAYLPANQTIVSGTAYENTYGIPVQAIGGIAFTTSGSVQVFYGKDPSSMVVIQTISVTAGNTIPFNLIVPPGWYFKLFTVTGTVGYSIVKLYASI